MNTVNRPLLSIIIPTRERVETLKHTVATVLNQASNAFELIISDNFSQDSTRDVIGAIKDSRVRYVNTGCRLSMCDSWEYALQHALGEYILFIGDDDAAMPGALDKLISTILLKSDYEVFSWPIHIYTWPIDGREAFVTHMAPQRSPAEMDLVATARHVVAMGGWRHYRIPCMYHSAVSRRISDEIRQVTGRVFHTTQPDVFLSMAVPVFAARALNVGYCVTVHGRSAKSNGGSSIAKSGAQVQDMFVSEYGDYQIDATLFPEIQMKINLIPDAVLVVMKLFPDFYGNMTFNYDAMWAYICRLQSFFGWPITVTQIIGNRKKIRQYHNFRVLNFLYYLALHKLSEIRRSLLNMINLPRLSREVVPPTIDEFVEQLAKEMEKI